MVLGPLRFPLGADRENPVLRWPLTETSLDEGPTGPGDGRCDDRVNPIMIAEIGGTEENHDPEGDGRPQPFRAARRQHIYGYGRNVHRGHRGNTAASDRHRYVDRLT